MKFNKGKCKAVLRNNCRHQYTLGAKQLKNGFSEKALRVLVHKRLTMS